MTDRGIVLDKTTGNLLCQPHLLSSPLEFASAVLSDASLTTDLSLCNPDLHSALLQCVAGDQHRLQCYFREGKAPPTDPVSSNHTASLALCPEAPARQPKPYVSFRVSPGGLPSPSVTMSAQIDTGCTSTLISSGSLPASLRPYVDPRVTGSCAGIGPAPAAVVGRIHCLRLEAGGAVVHVRADVVDQSLEPFLLGLDGLVEAGAAIDLKGGTLTIGGVDLPITFR